ncbi:DUF2314 domain-containing protein [Empedobacter brevis]|uniref:DUF2314 domain-containing protein n=1 Tax=Empedobacter brevis TaxID=247 RepID=UPI0023F1346A|nr:DUF2314 domain-containing protein [Empedobacter brevis]
MKYTFLAIAFATLLSSCGKKTEDAGVNAYKGLDKQKQEQKDLDSIGKEAQQTFDDFKLALSMKDTTTTNFMIQQKYQIPKSELKEGIWVSDIVNDNDTFKGIVNSTPQYIKELKAGDTITIDPNKIGDWMYYKGDKMIGGFTIKYLRSKLDDKQRAEFDKQYKVKFED